MGAVERNKKANDLSKSWAHRDGEAWTPDDDEFLLEEWVKVEPAHRDEKTISQIMQRTIEACRVRAHFVRVAAGYEVVHIGDAPSADKPYIGAFDEPEDCWWK